MLDTVGAQLLEDLLVTFGHHLSDRGSFAVEAAMNYVRQAAAEHGTRVSESLARIFDDEQPGWDPRAVHRLAADAQGLRGQRAECPPPPTWHPRRWRVRPKLQRDLF